MTSIEANEISITQEDAFAIEIEVQEKFREYISSYTSNIPLSKEWVKKKGRTTFFMDTDYSFYLLGIRFMNIPAKWNEYYVDASQEFKYCSYQFIPSKNTHRAFLPNGEPSFDRNGNPTQSFYDWVNSIILEILPKYVEEDVDE